MIPIHNGRAEPLGSFSMCVSLSLGTFLTVTICWKAPLYTLRVIDGGITALKDFAVISYLLFRTNYS